MSNSDPSAWTQITPAPGQPNPSDRYLPAMAYDPAIGGVLLFGGYGELGTGPWVFFQDTWKFSAGHWTELVANTSCAPSTCPSPRAGAMLAYDASENGMILFGGYVLSPAITYVSFSDTWLFAGGHWTNLSASAGTPPSPRFEGSMVWDSLDNYVLLFGGETSYVTTFGDTWEFDGTWTNISKAVEAEAPIARAGAAIADSPSGWIMMFGGANSSGVINDTPPYDCGVSTVAVWFHAGQWAPMAINTTTCVYSPESPAAPVPEATDIEDHYPPCGRVNAGLGWSPPNNRFVLFGGDGPSIQTPRECTGYVGFLNDSWTYGNQPGGDFYWNNATDPGYVGDPPARDQFGYAADFTDKYFEIFGGYGVAGPGTNDTWRFNELVHAQLTGPSSINTNTSQLSFNVPFTVTGYGGTGFLNYQFSIVGLKSTGNSLKGAGCTPLTNVTGNYSLPYNGVANIFCDPTAASYNVYRLTVTVFDVHNWSTKNRATANWTFSVLPPQTAIIYSEYAGYFYTGLDFTDKFSALLKVANNYATSVSATLGGTTLTFTQRSSKSFWWDSTPVDMGNLAPGATLELTAQFPGWTLNATYSVDMIDTPFWLTALIDLPGTTPTITSHGAGPFNKNWSLADKYDWNIAQAFGFSLPIPLVGGNYSLIPGLTITTGIDSGGNVSLTGSFSFSTSNVTIGPASLEISAKISLTGTFGLVTEGSHIAGITWVSATAKVTVTGDFSASVPIYGFSIFGIDVGFTLNIALDPSVALSLVLAPTNEPSQEIIPGLEVMLSKLIGSFTLPLSASVSFGIGIASVAIGGTLSVALTFNLYPSLGIAAGWVNGTLFVSATALFWSDQWDLLGPAVIYSWGAAEPVGLKAAESSLPGYNNGTSTTWKLASRYYATSGYDQNVWNPNSSGGPAVSDIYPFTSISAAPGYDGGYLYYTDDNAQLPVNQSLEVSALRLNASTNALSAVPAPSDPGYLADDPEAATLSDGSQFVAWAALPSAEETVGSPVQLSSLGLHGALYSPANRSWGPVRMFSNWGIVESYQVDAESTGGVVLAIISPTFLVGTSTPERLVAFDLSTGAVLSNVSVTGLSSVLSLRALAGDAVVRSVSGNDTVLDYSAGTAVPVSVSVPTNTSLTSERFVLGSESTLTLLYREPSSATYLALYNLSTNSVTASAVLGPDFLDVEAIYGAGTYYVFARTSSAIVAWTETGGTLRNWTAFGIPHLESFGVVQAGAGLLLFALSTNGNATAPIATLSLEELGATLSEVPGRPVVSPPPSTTPPPTTVVRTASPNNQLYLEYLAAAGAAVGVLLAVTAILTRKRRGSSPPSEGTAPPPSASGPPGAPP